jgi:transcription termination factor Rho
MSEFQNSNLNIMIEINNSILNIVGRKGGKLHDLSRPFQINQNQIFVPESVIRKYSLCNGVTISGIAQSREKGLSLTEVESICGFSPQQFKERKIFKNLTPINPEEKFDLSISNHKSMRIIDMFAPIGKGTRAMIVSPPKAGKTMLLEHFAHAINKTSPETRVIALLIDERPEEVTHFRRQVKAEVFASSSDQSVQEHVSLSELILDHIRTELECGRDIVVLVDSLTRMGRNFNASGAGTRRTMSGGISAGALEIPRRFFGLARNIENGGSVTIIATALVDTGSRMDQLIFEEFKGTGNCEIVLDRSLADQRIFPAINILKSGTRKDEKLHDFESYKRITKLRKQVAGLDQKTAMLTMLKMMDKYQTNEQLLKDLF